MRRETAQVAAQRADPLGYVADADALAAFRLLAHAEFEEYLERKATDGLAALEAAFRCGQTSVRLNPNIV